MKAATWRLRRWGDDLEVCVAELYRVVQKACDTRLTQKGCVKCLPLLWVLKVYRTASKLGEMMSFGVRVVEPSGCLVTILSSR